MKCVHWVIDLIVDIKTKKASLLGSSLFLFLIFFNTEGVFARMRAPQTWKSQTSKNVSYIHPLLHFEKKTSSNLPIKFQKEKLAFRQSDGRNYRKLQKQQTFSAPAYAMQGLVFFFQKVLSPQDGPTCPKKPVCSHYGQQALRKYGAFWGIIFASDRILRCHPYQNPAEYNDPLP